MPSWTLQKDLTGERDIAKIEAQSRINALATKMEAANKIEIASALKNCDKDIYPTIYTLLCILYTLPVTNASAEQYFSSLRRIKTWLRTTMLQKRLIGLAVLNVNYDINLKPEEVIDRFRNMSKHRIDLNL